MVIYEGMEFRQPLFLCATVFLTIIIIISSGCISEVENETIAENISEVMPTPTPYDPDAYISAIPESFKKEIIEAYFQDPSTGYIIKKGYISDFLISSRTYPGTDTIFPVIVFYFHKTVSSEPESSPTRVDCNIYLGTDLANQTIQMKSDAMKNGYVWISMCGVVIRDPTLTFGEEIQVYDADKHVVVMEKRVPAEEYDRLFS
ncbi:MAG: hypothetical protein Q7J08_01785 [Methanocorpusculum sp.]|uniref:hypothetical protein n=1 Tax=Methanocorpusculum sp. TaxID=2058474 RepID=UPI00271EFCA0|nr:hypothetical protein [Methanocorpusculum sp.]MDO9522423.1 hypothetical protein [Methanocorpusculum sp.]